MKFYIPFFGLLEKTIQMNFVQRFLAVFRNTQDIHRVLIVIPLTLLISHSLYLQTRAHVEVIFYTIKNEEIFWLALEGFIVLFVGCWAVFSSPFNPALYVRQGVFAIWTALLHRLGYGLESLGSTYFTVVSFIALTSFLPFAFTGLKNEQLFRKWKEEYESKKKSKTKYASEPAVVSLPADKSQGDAA
jgi:hypothetical protein